jgi:hypothetical protein
MIAGICRYFLLFRKKIFNYIFQGDGDDTHGAYKGNQQFDVILDGHAMVTLSLPDGKDENGKEKLREIVRCELRYF